MTSVEATSALPSVGGSAVPRQETLSPSPSSAPSSAGSEDETATNRSPRPKSASRKSSGTMLASRDPAAAAEEYDEHDVRNMSPRRNSAQVDQLGEEARQQLIEQAQQLQKSLEAIVNRVEAVKNEHEKLEGGNKFLQSYIGELMQTSKITSSAPSKSRGKGRSGK